MLPVARRVLLLATLAFSFADAALAQDRGTRRHHAPIPGTIPYAVDDLARGNGPTGPELRGSSHDAFRIRETRSIVSPAAPPAWHLPLAGAALGAAGGVIYVAARNDGQTIASPVAVLLPVPVGALIGYLAGVIADEMLYGGREP